MEFSSYLAFALVSAAQSATLGPSTLFLVNYSLAFGWCRALGALSGDVVAISLLATLSVVGLGALLVAYPVALHTLRLLGASYVIWLGWSYLRSTSPQEGATAMGQPAGEVDWCLGSTRSVWASPIERPSCSSPHPQFIPVGSGPSVLALLVSTFVVMKLVVLGGYALGARHVVRLLRKPEHARRGRVLTGIIFVAFGALMIWSALTAT